VDGVVIDDRAAELTLLDEVYDELHPICRSITGAGLRQSLDIVGRHLPLRRIQVPTGTEVLDWDIPEEWVIRDAWLEGPDGERLASFADSNLSVVNYSAPVDGTFDLEDLQPHLYSDPALPAATPYVTSYYSRRWGFCLPHHVRAALLPGRYRAYVDSDFVAGGLDFGDLVLQGATDREILLSTYLCHPSLANNELSGPLVAILLHRRLARWPHRRFTYRFVVAPETIGAIAYLAAHGDELRERLHAGLVLTCLGGPDRPLNYKRSRRGDAPVDVVVHQLMESGGLAAEMRPFDPSEGSDERQYCSPGFDLPVGQAARMVYGRYPEYHSSADTKELMGIAALQQSADDVERILRGLELDGYYVNLRPYGEIKLDRHGLYPPVNAPGSQARSMDALRRVRFILNWSDGRHLLSDVARRCGCSLLDLADAVAQLVELGLLAGPFEQRQP
jgi:aminopeptidase-like protein